MCQGKNMMIVIHMKKYLSPSICMVYYKKNIIGNAVRCVVQTQSQARSSGIKLPKVHGISKGLDPNIQPEKQIVKPLFKETGKTKNRTRKSRIKKEEAIYINQPIAQSVENSKIPVLPKIPTEVINMPNLQPLCNPSVLPAQKQLTEGCSK